MYAMEGCGHSFNHEEPNANKHGEVSPNRVHALADNDDDFA